VVEDVPAAGKVETTGSSGKQTVFDDQPTAAFAGEVGLLPGAHLYL
jgi:hypothetical protein